MHRLVLLLLGAATLLAGPRAGAQNPAKVPFEQYTLDNGLTVILSEDHSAQVVAVTLYYDVGSRNERPGRTGFAHLFEHMMFQGSENVQKRQHSELIQFAGGTVNGTTAEDRTFYFEVLPSNRLNLGLWLEADRMRSLAVTDSNFTNQRQAVKEERRLRVDNQPYAGAIAEQSYTLYDSSACFPYSHSIIGSMADLDAATTAEARQFFQTYYAPNNATLVIVGDFDPAAAKRMIQDYFGRIPRGTTPQPLPCDPRFGAGPQRRSVRDDKATLPATVQLFRAPAYDHADYPALELLATVLGQGESSRLNRRLAREAKAAIAAQSFLNLFGPRRGPGVFMAFAIANQGVRLDSLDGLLTREIARIAGEGVSEQELTKAKNSYRATLIMGRQQALSVADALQSAKMFLGSPEAVNTNYERYLRVTVDDVKRVAATYLRPDNSLTLLISSEATP